MFVEERARKYTQSNINGSVYFIKVLYGYAKNIIINIIIIIDYWLILLIMWQIRFKWSIYEQTKK